MMDASLFANSLMNETKATVNAIPLKQSSENRDVQRDWHTGKGKNSENEKTDWRIVISFKDEYNK